MPSKPYKTWVEVSRSALVANAQVIRRVAGSATKVAAVVKADAYGHGLKETVRAVKAHVDVFAVDALREALAVREIERKKPVLILGYARFAELKTAVAAGFHLTVANAETVSRLHAVGTPKRPALVHLKIETGTSRQGIAREDLSAMLRLAKRSNRVRIVGLSTHYANIEDTADPSYAMGQLKAFDDARSVARAHGVEPEYLHTAASAATFLYPETRFTMVRAGIALYGLWPSEATRDAAAKKRLRLAPALTWKTIVAQVKRLVKGTPVSYGLTERVSRDSVVAVLPVGYWDGYDRGLSSVGNVLIKGRRAKVLGRVCMNMCMVDVTDISGVALEDEATLIGFDRGERVTAEELASAAGTINYEIVSRINPLIPRLLAR